MKEQINLRASDLTVRQLNDLTDWCGTSRTETIAIAIDRMHRAEQERKMEYRHEVPSEIREASRWDPVNFVNVTPANQTWIYADPGLTTGHILRDSAGDEVLVARWYPSEHLPFTRCLTAKQVEAEEAAENLAADIANGVADS